MSAEKTKRWRNNTEKKGRKKAGEKKVCSRSVEVCCWAEGWRWQGGEAGTLTDICWHAADAGGGTVP